MKRPKTDFLQELTIKVERAYNNLSYSFVNCNRVLGESETKVYQLIAIGNGSSLIVCVDKLNYTITKLASYIINEAFNFQYPTVEVIDISLLTELLSFLDAVPSDCLS